MANSGAKLSELCESGVLGEHTCGTLNLIVFSVIFGVIGCDVDCNLRLGGY